MRTNQEFGLQPLLPGALSFRSRAAPLELRSPPAVGPEGGSAMANALLDKVPQALKSMYYAENELRRALFKGVMLRTDEAREHLAQARGHFDNMLGSRKPEPINPPNPTE